MMTRASEVAEQTSRRKQSNGFLDDLADSLLHDHERRSERQNSPKHWRRSERQNSPKHWRRDLPYILLRHTESELQPRSHPVLWRASFGFETGGSSDTSLLLGENGGITGETGANPTQVKQ